MNQLQNVFKFNDSQLRTVVKDGEPWFVAKDVCEILEVGNPSQALSRLDEDEKNTIILNEGIGNPEKSIVNEAGLYSLILSSRKHEAKAFKRWVTHEVLPQIRQTGQYSKPQSIEDLIIMQAQSMKDIRQQLESTKMEIATAHAEIKDVKQGLVDINEPLRKQFNDAVRSYSHQSNIGFNQAYNNVYNLINAQHHVNIQQRVENRKNKNKNIRPIDIIEELNLLVPAIRLAKSLNERVSV